MPERLQRRRSDIFIVNFEHISHLVLVFLLLTLDMNLPAGFTQSNSMESEIRLSDCSNLAINRKNENTS